MNKVPFLEVLCPRAISIDFYFCFYSFYIVNAILVRYSGVHDFYRNVGIYVQNIDENKKIESGYTKIKKLVTVSIRFWWRISQPIDFIWGMFLTWTAGSLEVQWNIMSYVVTLCHMPHRLLFVFRRIHPTPTTHRTHSVETNCAQWSSRWWTSSTTTDKFPHNYNDFGC